MITGVVNARHEAMIRVPVQDTNGREQEIEAIIDTGFNGSLTLPPPVIAALGLPWRTRGNAILANGSEDQFDIYAATVTWDGTPGNILVEAADTDPLVGTALSVGVETHTIGTVSVRIFNPEKTVADCFKFRNKIGLDVAVKVGGNEQTPQIPQYVKRRLNRDFMQRPTAPDTSPPAPSSFALPLSPCSALSPAESPAGPAYPQQTSPSGETSVHHRLSGKI